MSNSFIGDNINAIRIHKGLSQNQLARAAGVSQTTVSAWERGTSTPRKSNAMRILAAIPGIDYDDIMSEENGFANRLKRSIERGSQPSGIPPHSAISADAPIEILNVEDTFPIPMKMRDRYPNAFLMKVTDSSMDRILPDGCYALVDPCDAIDRNGDPYAVRVDECDTTIKRVRKLNNGFELMPDSTDPTYPARTYNYNEPGTETIKIIGRVVYYVLPFDWSF